MAVYLRGMKLSELDLLSIGNTIQLAGALFAGESKLFLVPFPEDQGDFKGYGDFWYETPAGEELLVEVLHLDAADWETFIRQTDILETEVLQNASDGTLAKVVLRKSTRQIDTKVSWRVFHRDGFKCRYCGEGPGIPLTVDHLVLWEEGGPSIQENLTAACKKCNKTRASTPFEEWLHHPYYLRVSRNLTQQTREANNALVATLKAIPRVANKRSR